MNNRPVEQALSLLVPTHANDLPPELVSLALSLVAQSRSFAASLKPEEEIARPYACAEIACRRLSRTLKLPPLLGHPPCPPRAYKKLYSFLERSLSTSASGSKRARDSSAPGTPSRSGSAPSTPTKTQALAKTAATPRGLQNTPSKSTPLKQAVNASDRPAAPLSTSQKTTKVRPHGLSSSTIIPDAPAWVMDSIRTVCKTLSTPAPRTSTWSRPPISRTLPPHIFAGVSSILYLIPNLSAKNDEDLDEEMMEFLEPIITVKDTDKDEDFKEVVYALVVAVYFIVLARRRNPPDDGSSEAGEARKMDKKTFSEMRQTALVSLGLPSTERRHRDDVDQWIALIMEQGWMNGQEWFENIPQAGEVDGDDEYLSDEYGAPDNERKRQKTTGAGHGFLLEDSSKRKGLLPGLGTMMQDRVDWLSVDRREDYIEWKADIMARIQQLTSAR
ncbi:hypothetical protein CNMCM5623_003217 [Aspergillus felis]|uniref:ORC6 first cyclin-like domain-containing protein n=1 Tax=Aspergillus felis TaxID=1287682 RepID=A0A8H6PIH5_9EURO|nr:hypothetical protein CNMCM5623_003217 [Aspergillus felis]KAF7176196.1 hypothetical protein CNMCM7691_001912 [Aspergillus felis]